MAALQVCRAAGGQSRPTATDRRRQWSRLRPTWRGSVIAEVNRSRDGPSRLRAHSPNAVVAPRLCFYIPPGTIAPSLAVRVNRYESSSDTVRPCSRAPQRHDPRLSVPISARELRSSIAHDRACLSPLCSSRREPGNWQSQGCHVVMGSDLPGSRRYQARTGNRSP